MRAYLIMIFVFFVSLQLNAQHLVKSEKFKISFQVAEILENYVTESDSVLGYENDNYAVDIEIVALTEETEEFISNLKYGAKTIAIEMGFENIVNGGIIPNIEDAYYVITQEKEGNTLVPVYILAIINFDQKIAYEISIYCYNLNKLEGENIVKSFKLEN